MIMKKVAIMTHEEKLKEAKKLYESANAAERYILEWLYPELKESEDETIRKSLIEMVHDTTGDKLWVDYGIHKEETLAWLEKQGEQKPALSEKDEVMRLTVLQVLQNIRDSYPNVNVNPEINWLESLKERYTWKPSEEQIKAVRLARSFVVDDFDENPTLSEILIELEKQLKKL